MIKMRKPMPIGALISDNTTKRLAIVMDKMSTSEWGRIDMDNDFYAGIIYGIHFMDGLGPYKAYRYAYEVRLLSGKNE